MEHQLRHPPVAATDGGSLAADIGINIIKSVDWQITRCRFGYFGNGALYLIVIGDSVSRGLI